MSIWDDLGKGISSAAAATAQKTRDMAEITRLSLSLSGRESDLREIYAALGGAVCGKYAAILPEELKADAERAEALRREIDGIRRRLLELRNMVLCGACGGENSPTARFCSHCGAKLAAPLPVLQPDLSYEEAELFEEAARPAL